MVKALRVPVFGLILAAQTCSVEDCSGCGKVDHRANGPTLAVGQFMQFSADCSTCGHAEVSATWLAVVESYGEVTLTAQAKCGKVTSQGHSISVKVKEQTATISELGVKNLCGDNDPVTWTVYLSNDASDPIEATKLNVACPNQGSTPNALAPSAIR